MVELYCGNSLRVKAVGYFRRDASSLMFYGTLKETLSEEKVSTTGVTQGNLELLLCSNSPDSQQTQIHDHHALIFLLLKTTFTKIPPNKLQYRNYKKLEVHSFLQDVKQLPEKISCTKWEKD